MPSLTSEAPTMAAGGGRDLISESSDYESTSSSTLTTAIGSRRSHISDTSFESSFSGSNISLRSFAAAESFCSLRRGGSFNSNYYKPHKANQAEWEAIAVARAAAGGRVGLDQFRLFSRLGSGDLGSVYLCRLRDPRSAGCLYAMKVVDREALAARKKLQRAETEREILRAIDHPFLPTLYAEFDAAHYSCILMEFCPGGDLHVARQRQHGRRFSISSAKFYVAETVVALEYLHMMGIVYRDLKPENVLVRDDGHIMLSDFDLSFKCHVIPKIIRRTPIAGDPPSTPRSSSCVRPAVQPVLSCFYGGAAKCARKVKLEEEEEEDNKEKENELGSGGGGAELVAEPITERSKSFVGTHEYLAPEVISGLGHGGAVDWWTLGVFLYEMLFGRTPFKGEDNEKTLINIIKSPLTFPRITNLAGKDLEEFERAKDLITKLLVKNPKRRIGSSKGAAEIKRHEFFKGVNWALIRSVRPPEVPRELHRRGGQRNAPARLQKLSRKEREEPYSIPPYFDYF